jgi:hypothetical protein
MNKYANTFGWVDFNKKDREEALKLIEANKTQGSIDELGLGVLRDAFSDIFFPGVTTIQTRARYFLLIPYWLKKVADNKKTISLEEFEKRYFELERCPKVIPVSEAEITSGKYAFHPEILRNLFDSLLAVCMSWQLFSIDSRSVKHLAMTV